MPNANIIARLVGANTPAQGANAIPSIVPTVTSAFVPTNQAGNAAALTVAQGSLISGATAAPSFGVNFDGFAFKLRITGKVTTGASCNVTVAIQTGSTTTVTAGNSIATTGALAVNTTSANFLLEAVCMWDVVSQLLQGTISPTSWVNTSAVSAAALSHSLTITAQSSLVFVPVLTFSATTGATLTITEFVAETL